MAKDKGSSADAADEIDKNAWMVTFSDLLTLMITFFVLLLSMSSMDDAKLKEMFGALESDLGVLEMGMSEQVAMRGNPTMSFEILSQQLFQEMGIVRDLFQAITADEGLPINSLKGNIDFDKQVVLNERGLVITLADDLLFGPGETNLRPEVLIVLDRLAERFKKTKFIISIEGHSDTEPAGTGKSNWAISARRAMNVMHYLSENDGVPAQRLSARGYGEHVPLVKNDTPENRAKNRRIEIVITKRW